MKVGVAVVDVLTGLNAAVAILAALHRRSQTGEGELIEVSLLDSALAALVNVAAGALLTGEEARRYGNAHPSIVPYQPFRTADGSLAVAAANDGLYRKLCAAIGIRSSRSSLQSSQSGRQTSGFAFFSTPRCPQERSAACERPSRLRGRRATSSIQQPGRCRS